MASHPPAIAGDDLCGSAASPRTILKSRSKHVAAALLLVKKPLNQLFQSRFASRQAHFWFVTIPIPPVVNNHALEISNTNKSQPKTRQGVWWSKERGIRTSTKDGTTSVTSFLLFCLVDKSICNSKRCRE